MGPRTQCQGPGFGPARGPEAVEHLEGVQLAQAHASPALPGEGDVGDLVRQPLRRGLEARPDPRPIAAVGGVSAS